VNIFNAVSNPLRIKSSRGFENITLAGIAGLIAKKYQLMLIGSIETINIDRATLYEETGLSWPASMAMQ